RWQGSDPPEPDSMKVEPDWALFPEEPERLNEIAWKLVGSDRDMEGNEPLALKLVRRGLEHADADVRIELRDTLAWALFRNGRAKEARKELEALRHDWETVTLEDLRTALGKSQKKLEEELNRLEQRGFLNSYRLETERLTEEAQKLQLDLEAETAWTFDSASTLAQHRFFSKLSAGLESLADPRGESAMHTTAKYGMSVPERAKWARSLSDLTLTSEAAREVWQYAIASIRDRTQCPKYDGLVIEPQLGLLPLGRDPESGLWEFHYPITGDAPARGAEPRLCRAGVGAADRGRRGGVGVGGAALRARSPARSPWIERLRRCARR
ncbi:MAG TPA: hypothetical protein PKW35_20715, partial [Nannocystaceae bacterium]|nr:hypothetical protein [Nannocystaceae bacterium]